MTARKPADPRDEVQITNALRDRPEGTGRRSGAEEPVPAPADGEEVEQHENVEVESGPVDREDGDDPLPQAR